MTSVDEAINFVHRQDLTADELREFLRGTSSDLSDWLNILNNINSKPDERTRPYSMRLKLAVNRTSRKDFGGNVRHLSEKNLCTISTRVY